MNDEELNDLNTAIAVRLRAEGKFVPSTTTLNDQVAIRPCYINPRTTQTEVDGLAQRVREIGEQMIAGEG